MTYEEWLEQKARYCVEIQYYHGCDFFLSKLTQENKEHKSWNFDYLYVDRFVEEGYGHRVRVYEDIQIATIDFTDKFKALMELVK
ncbi:MAG: hypothetical protein QW318_07710 [Candidatus Caldarchaeum sp.]